MHVTGSSITRLVTLCNPFFAKLAAKNNSLVPTFAAARAAHTVLAKHYTLEETELEKSMVALAVMAKDLLFPTNNFGLEDEDMQKLVHWASVDAATKVLGRVPGNMRAAEQHARTKLFSLKEARNDKEQEGKREESCGEEGDNTDGVAPAGDDSTIKHTD